MKLTETNMTYNQIINFVCIEAHNHIERKKNDDKYLNGYSLGKYSVSSHIRDNRKKHNILQKIIIKLFKI